MLKYKPKIGPLSVMRETRKQELLEYLFAEFTEEEKRIASKFPLSEKILKQLCKNNRVAVRMDVSNLLVGIEKKIELEFPAIKYRIEVRKKVYNWHKSHLRASKKYCKRHWKQMEDDKENLWIDRKIHNLVKLGIHPRMLCENYEKSNNFDEAIKIVESFDYSDDESESESMVTVINTQTTTNSGQEDTVDLIGAAQNTEDLIGAGQNEEEIDAIDHWYYFNSEEVVLIESESFDVFNNSGQIFTSTQNND